LAADRPARAAAGVRAREDARRTVVLPLVLLWLCGIALRITILAVPPVVPMIAHDFALSATEVGLLGSIAPALFALAALGGALLVARIGVRGALVGGLVVIAMGAALRGAAPNFPALILTSVIMAAGVAIMQPVMPTSVRHWLPREAIGLGTATYTNGLLVGEVIPVLVTLPLVLPLLGGSWRAALAAWAVPVALTAWLVYARAPRFPDPFLADKGTARRWLPDWRSGLVWRLGVLFAVVNGIYFGTNAFIPTYLASQGRADLIGGTLTALNFGQIPASLLLLAVARKLERRAWPYLLSAVLSLLALGGLVFAVGPWTYAFAALLGFSDAAALIIGLTLPPLLCAPQDVARTSAGVFTLSYGSAVVVALLSGAIWDATGIPATAFLPFALCAVILTLATLALVRHGELR
jgi:CP family cyanate transporter-like MFS transporter